MPRPIDADALKEDLTRFYAGEVTARDLIDEQPTIGGWISVKDRLPDRNGEYMVYGQSEAMWELLPDNIPIWICYYCKEHGFYNIELCREYNYITHWMQLPEAPKEDGNAPD